MSDIPFDQRTDHRDPGGRRRRILAALRVWTSRLERLLAGQEVRLPSLPLPGETDPAEDPLSRARRAVRLYQGLLLRMEQGTYGRCEGCGRPIPGEELDETPWATLCSGCR